MKQVKWYFVAETASIPKNEGRKVCFGGKEFALFNLGSEFRAVDNRCPHKQGPLADGIVSGRSVFCPLHSLKVSLENGCTPAGSCVTVYPVKVIDKKVHIAFHEGMLSEETHQGSELVMDERI